MFRRNRLVALVLLSAISGGCLAGAPGTPTSTPAPSLSDVGTPEPCDGNETRPDLGIPDASLPSRAGGFELAANATNVRPGEPLAFSLTNVAEKQRTTGTSKMYVLQHRSGDSWQTITLFRGGRAGYNATAVPHDPGEGFDWSFRASATGFATGTYVVCDRLSAGEYRFVYATPELVAVGFEIRAEN